MKNATRILNEAMVIPLQQYVTKMVSAGGPIKDKPHDKFKKHIA